MGETGRLDGRHALVTGGGRGIGAAVARALKRGGAAVTVLGRSQEALGAAVAAGDADGFAICDITDPDALATAFADAAAGRGPVDILVNNAGAVESAPFARIGREQWDRMIAVNLTAVFAATQLALPTMLERRFGRVVNIASTAGLTGYPYVAAYCAAKHGVVGMTRALAREVATSGITVNAVCPGYTDTDMVRGAAHRIAAKTGRAEADVVSEFVRVNPQGRLVQPEEVAAAVSWLCGPAAAAVTGIALPIAGGEVG